MEGLGGSRHGVSGVGKYGCGWGVGIGGRRLLLSGDEAVLRGLYSIREDDRSFVGEGKRRGNMCVFCVRLEMADRACSRIRNEVMS